MGINKEQVEVGMLGFIKMKKNKTIEQIIENIK